MPRYAQLVMGPAGSGKSTYCTNMLKHCEALRRTVHVVNLDPAAEQFDYPVLVDVRELIQVEDAMEDDSLRFGPNGGLIFCMEYLAQNFDWLQEQLDDIEDDYILFDCPGQIELYTHVPVMKQLVDVLQAWNFRVCVVYLLESQFLTEASKFVSGCLSALSTLVNLEAPHVNVLTKVDLLSKKDKKNLDRYLCPEMSTLLMEEFEDTQFNKKFKKLNGAIAEMIDSYSLVGFHPLDQNDEESINDILLQIDTCLQYGEDQEPRELREVEEDPDMIDSGFDG